MRDVQIPRPVMPVAPFGALTRAHLLHHAVDLFERQALGLRHKPVGKQGAGRAHAAPEEEDFISHVAGVLEHERDDDGDDAVPEPIGSGREGDTFGADGQLEDLADDDPGGGSPGAGEEEDVDAHEHDEAVVGHFGVGLGGADAGDDEFAHHHAHGPVDEQRAAAEAFDRVEGNGRAGDVDGRGDHGGQEGPITEAGEADLLEESRVVVEDEVDAGELLKHLQRRAEEDLAAVGVAVLEASAEAAQPPHLAQLLLVFVVGLDFGQFVQDVLAVVWLTTHARQSDHGLVQPTLFDVITGRFGEEEQAGGQDDGPQKLDRDGNPERAGVGEARCFVGDDAGQKDADGDGELVAGHDRPANVSWRNFGHVHDVDRRNEADSEACDQTAHGQRGDA